MRPTFSRRQLLFSFIVLIATIGLAAQFLISNPTERDVANYIANTGIAGGVLAIRAPDGSTRAVTFGEAQLDEALPIASISKPITAAAVHDLADQVRLRLDQEVLPLLDLPAPADPRWQRITIRHLLQHTGGWDREISGDPLYKPHPVPCRAAARRMINAELDFYPGSRQAYSNFGYCLLGLVIEKMTDGTYADHVFARFLRPLGLTSFRTNALDTASGGWVASAPEVATLLASFDVAPAIAPPSVAWRESYLGLGWRVWPDDGNISHAGDSPDSFTLAIRRGDGTVIVMLLAGRAPDFAVAWPRFYHLLKAL